MIVHQSRQFLSPCLMKLVALQTQLRHWWTHQGCWLQEDFHCHNVLMALHIAHPPHTRQENTGRMRRGPKDPFHVPFWTTLPCRTCASFCGSFTKRGSQALCSRTRSRRLRKTASHLLMCFWCIPGECEDLHGKMQGRFRSISPSACVNFFRMQTISLPSHGPVLK